MAGQALGEERDRFQHRQVKEAHRVVLFRGAETHARSVVKAVSWRTLGTLDTFGISWLLTGRAEIAGSIAGLEIILHANGHPVKFGAGVAAVEQVYVDAAVPQHVNA